MDISSHLLAELANGVCLETRVDGQTIGTYVVLGPADLDAIADIVPRQRVEEGADIHAAAVDSVDGAQMEIDQVIENMNPGDVAVFFCADGDCYGAALDLLDLPVDE